MTSARARWATSSDVAWRSVTAMVVVAVLVAASALPVRIAAAAPLPPIGNLERAAPAGPGTVAVVGWALVPAVPAATQVDVLVDGRWAASELAIDRRPDVGAAYPDAGALHGFSLSVAVPPGVHEVCVAAHGLGGPGPSIVGCRSVDTVTPLGNFESAEALPGAVRLRGWALHPDRATPSPLTITMGDDVAWTGGADIERPDVTGSYPGYPQATGFDVVVPAISAPHVVCVAATGAVSLGCRSVTVGGPPVGNLEVAAAGIGSVIVRGWALDPDVALPAQLRFTVDGVTTATGITDRDRPDVAAAFAGSGPTQGFRTVLPVAPGRHEVCAHVADVGRPEGGELTIGCRSVTVDDRFGTLAPGDAPASWLPVDRWTDLADAAPGNYSRLGLTGGVVTVPDPFDRDGTPYLATGLDDPRELGPGEYAPGIGGAFVETGWTDVEVTVSYLGDTADHTVEAAPCLHVTPGTVAMCVGAWPSVLPFGDTSAGVVLVGLLGSPPQRFRVLGYALYEHDTGPHRISLRSVRGRLTVALDGAPLDLYDLEGTAVASLSVPTGLRPSTAHGFAVDIHLDPWTSLGLVDAVTIAEQ